MYSFKKVGENYEVYYYETQVYKEVTFYDVVESITGTKLYLEYNNTKYTSFITKGYSSLFLIILTNTSLNIILSAYDSVLYGQTWGWNIGSKNYYSYFHNCLLYYCPLKKIIIKTELQNNIKSISYNKKYLCINTYDNMSFYSVENFKHLVTTCKSNYKLFKNKIVYYDGLNRCYILNDIFLIKIKKSLRKNYKIKNNLYKIEYV